MGQLFSSIWLTLFGSKEYKIVMVKCPQLQFSMEKACKLRLRKASMLPYTVYSPQSLSAVSTACCSVWNKCKSFKIREP